MYNLKYRKVELELLIDSLQTELNLVNEQLKDQKAETESKEDTTTIRGEMITAIIKNVYNGSNIDLTAIEKRYINSTKDENGNTFLNNFTLEKEVLSNKKWKFVGHEKLNDINFKNSYLKDTQKALYLYESKNIRYILELNSLPCPIG